MGNILCIEVNKENIIQQRCSNLSVMYHTKMYSSSRKSINSFMKQIDLLCKKMDYINYQWCRIIRVELCKNRYMELYVEYESTLQQNCRRDGRYELVFYANRIRSIFLQQIMRRYNLMMRILNINELKQLILQCKYYLMVISWFHRISSYRRDRDQCVEDIEDMGYIVNEDRIYCMLVDAAAKTYVQYLQKQEISKIWIIDESYNPQYINLQIYKPVRELRENNKFYEKQKSILYLQQILKQNYNNLQDNILFLKRIYGNSQIFGHLFIIRNIGNGDIQFLWRVTYGYLYDRILK